MGDLEEKYEKVYNKLKSFCDTQNLIDLESNKIDSAYSEDISSLSKELEEKTKTKKECEKRLIAFLDIAKAHATKLEDNGEIEAYDSGILSRLTVQINNGSHNDSFAEQLFTHSSCQLRGVRASIQDLYTWQENQKLEIRKKCNNRKIDIDRKMNECQNEIASYVSSDEFKSFIEILKDDSTKFNSNGSISEASIIQNEISIGIKHSRMPIPNGFENIISNMYTGSYANIIKSIGVPVTIDTKSGSGLLVEYINENENEILCGINNFILNALRYGIEYRQIVYIDPVRYNGSSLGILHPLSFGDNSTIDGVPLSIEEVRKKINSLISQINIDERKIINNEIDAMPKRLLVLHNFPNAYDSTMINQIQQLFVNAEHYNITIIATHNNSLRDTVSTNSITLIQSVARRIKCNGLLFGIEDTTGDYEFEWYKLPNSLPQDVKFKFIENRPVINTDNDYDSRVGIDSTIMYEKGNRKLEKIPYGVDADGNVLYLDFENENFATFVCGASRSGKSTLLHTLITGLIKNNHPDDIEMWLIDLKLTEFSRYTTDYLPPHVRYIVLDESPELIYDIIDRITEILTKRENAFKGKWNKLSEVPKEKYMPSILVIIDEFSVMSNIIADSSILGNENYSVKLSTLLSKGGGLGLHFIFANQGFMSGTRGLNDFSKKQIQQRIALKTEYSEIRDTLDLKSVSDNDKMLMEQLPIHHALVRIPVDANGNHLKQAKVLYISDYTKQEKLITKVKNMVQKAPKYDADNVNVYIDKKPIIIDGSVYSAFLSHKDIMLKYIETDKLLLDSDGVALFIGEPKRMDQLHPIMLDNEFCENVLIVSPIVEKMATSSIVMSAMKSLEFMYKDIDVWANKKNEVYRQVIIESQQEVNNVYKKLNDICAQIRNIKSLIERKIEGNKYIFILGTESLLTDMSYQSKSSASEFTIKRRAAGEKDIISSLALLQNEKNQQTENRNININNQSVGTIDTNTEIKNDSEYDAREDLKFIMTHGPRLGYHFIVVFNTAGEFNQSKIDVSLCKHKILFRMPKTDAAGIIGFSNANVVVKLGNHAFRYSNGIDSLSFRPYLHPGLSWDGWSANMDDAIKEDEEEYLM